MDEERLVSDSLRTDSRRLVGPKEDERQIEKQKYYSSRPRGRNRVYLREAFRVLLLSRWRDRCSSRVHEPGYRAAYMSYPFHGYI